MALVLSQIAKNKPYLDDDKQESPTMQEYVTEISWLGFYPAPVK
jgi:hypothetical protein